MKILLKYQFLWPVPLLLVSGVALIFAGILQYFFGLHPCYWCLWQRVPYGLLLILTVFTLWSAWSVRFQRVLAFIGGFIGLSGVVLAVYHVGIEQYWWESGACTTSTADDFESFKAQIMSQSRAAPSCTEVSWDLFGISLAGYNVFLSFLVMVYCFVIATLLLKDYNLFQKS